MEWVSSGLTMWMGSMTEKYREKDNMSISTFLARSRLAQVEEQMHKKSWSYLLLDKAVNIFTYIYNRQHNICNNENVV